MAHRLAGHTVAPTAWPCFFVKGFWAAAARVAGIMKALESVMPAPRSFSLWPAPPLLRAPSLPPYDDRSNHCEEFDFSPTGKPEFLDPLRMANWASRSRNGLGQRSRFKAACT